MKHRMILAGLAVGLLAYDAGAGVYVNATASICSGGRIDAVMGGEMQYFISPNCWASSSTTFWGPFVVGATYQMTIYCDNPSQVLDDASASGSSAGCLTFNCLSTTNCWTGNGYDKNSAAFSFSFVPEVVSFHWDFPKDGIQALNADGQSTVRGSVIGSPGALNWGFDGPNLGCKLNWDANGVTVTSGTNTGTVMIVATNSGAQCFEEPLDLVDCSSCAKCNQNGGPSFNNNSVDVRIGLGWALEGTTAGYLHIKADSPTNWLSTPMGLRYDFRRAEVEVYTNAYGLYQVRSPHWFVNVVTNSAWQYTIQLYSATNITTNAMSGPYSVTNAPYRTITVETPNGNTNEVIFTDSNNGTTYDYTWQTNGWLLDTANGLRKELKTSVASATNSAIYTITRTIWQGTGPVVYTESETYQTNSYGDRMISKVIGSGTDARTNTYSYTTSGYLQEVIRWDGSWEYYRYDAYNRPTNKFSGFLNQGVTTDPTLCRLTVYDYSSNAVAGSGDTGLKYFYTPRCTIDYVKNVEVGRTYFVALEGQYRKIQCVEPGASWSNADNLVTTYNLFTNGFHLYEPQTVVRPDGTADVYEYGAIGQTTTNIVLTGHLDSTGTNVDDGTETVTVLNPAGNAISRTVVDIHSQLVTDQESYSYDGLNRLTNTLYLDGTSVGLSRDCCTISSRTDRAGTTTFYTYDALNRLLTSTINGVTSSNWYDASGDVLGTYRIGSDTTTTQSLSTYDDGGNLLSRINALGTTNVFTWGFDGSGELVKTDTQPDGSTIVDTYALDGSLVKHSGNGTFGIRYEYGTESAGVDGFGNTVTNYYEKEIKLDGSGNDTAEWTKTYTDTAGRTWKTVYPDTAVNTSVYNAEGQLSARTDPDGVTMLYEYNPRGELTYTAVDLNGNGTIDFGGSDRVTYITNDVLTDNGTTVRRTRTYVWATDGVDASNLISTVENSVDGRETWNTSWNDGIAATETLLTEYDPLNGYKIVTRTAPDGSYVVTTNQYSRVISVTSYPFVGDEIRQTTYGYDDQGRQSTVTDARNGTTTYYFNNDDQVSGIVTPIPATGQSAEVTTNFFDSMGRIWKTTLPDNTSSTNEYYSNGLLELTAGSRTYPVEYTYDYAGRMKTMTTWTNYASSSGAAVTTWNYDIYRGFLTNKIYDGGVQGPIYTYTLGGRLKTRVWARNITTTYGYDGAGEPQSIAYSDSTPGLTAGYDRRGRETTITNGATICSRSFNDAGLLTSESYAGGPLDGMSISNEYDEYLRRTNLIVVRAGVAVSQQSFGYDQASRLQTIDAGPNCTATYSYVANSPLVGQISFTNNGVLRMTTTSQHDYLGRLTLLQSSAGGSNVTSFSYANNSANQRTSVTNVGNTYWIYQYDSLGQVTSGKKYWGDGTPVAGQQFEYSFDDIGNRMAAAFGGDQFGANLRKANYTDDSQNQIISRDVPGYVNMIGSADSNAVVRVNGGTTYRRNEYFRGELNYDNTIGALYPSITSVAVLPQPGTNADIAATNTGNTFLPKTPEAITYDADGNLTTNGSWNITWGAENRATSFIRPAGAPDISKLEIDCTYDYMGRRIQKVISTWNGSTYVPQSTNRFIYDGWNLIAMLDQTNGLVYSFDWGIDVSGTMQGAGGVGGLISSTLYIGTNSGTYFYCFDGNANAYSLVNATNGAIAAQYEYGPFGEVIRMTGPMAKANPFRFSTKYQDDESDLVYYGYRYYNPSTGRWPNRDPLDEPGFELLRNDAALGNGNSPNLYVFVDNDSIDGNDSLGLSFWNPGWLKGLQRAFWKEVAEKYMRPHGLNMSADLLEHSLLDSPSDLIPYQTAAQPMQNSVEMIQFYRRIPLGCYNDWTTPQDVKLQQNRDLFVAFEDVRVSYKGCKCCDICPLDFRVTDRYVFHWQAPEMQQKLATVSANAAYISQMLGAITPFNEEVDFTMPHGSE